MLEEIQECEEIIERVAALDIGKAELVSCVRVPGAAGRSRRVQEVTIYKMGCPTSIRDESRDDAPDAHTSAI